MTYDELKKELLKLQIKSERLDTLYKRLLIRRLRILIQLDTMELWHAIKVKEGVDEIIDEEEKKKEEDRGRFVS